MSNETVQGQIGEQENIFAKKPSYAYSLKNDVVCEIQEIANKCIVNTNDFED